ncbi:MAG: I78 family peptidase inhibitor [Pseudomonadota bacterium]
MKKFRAVFGPAALISFLSACAADAPPPDAAPAADDIPEDQLFFDCITGDPAALIGQSATAAGAGHNGPVRVIPQGSVITQDYDIKRLNLITDPATGQVVRVYCG